jgi:peptidase E
MTIFLATSIGLSSKKVYKEALKYTKQLSLQYCGIIVNANLLLEKNKYAQITKKQLFATGFKKVEYIDLNKTNAIQIIQSCDTIVLVGGNTFLLKKSIEYFEQKNNLTNLFNKKLVVGISAGSLVLSPSIRIAREIDPDDFIKTKNLDGLTMIPVEIFPHYTVKNEHEILEYEKKYNTCVIRLNNHDFYTYIT